MLSETLLQRLAWQQEQEAAELRRQVCHSWLFCFVSLTQYSRCSNKQKRLPIRSAKYVTQVTLAYVVRDSPTESCFAAKRARGSRAAVSGMSLVAILLCNA